MSRPAGVLHGGAIRPKGNINLRTHGLHSQRGLGQGRQGEWPLCEGDKSDSLALRGRRGCPDELLKGVVFGSDNHDPTLAHVYTFQGTVHER